jgi:hypothetical protein
MGADPESRAINLGKKHFSTFLARSPQATDLYSYNLTNCTIIDEYKRVVMQYSSVDTYKDFRYILTEFDNPITIGSIVVEKNTTAYTDVAPVEEYSYWLVLREEAHPVLSYHQYIALRCNTMLRTYDYYNGTNIKTIPVHAIDTASAGRYTERFLQIKNLVIADTKKMVQIIATPLIDYKNYNQFIIKEDGWKIVEVDKVSVPDVYYISLVENKLAEDRIDDTYDDLIVGNDWSIAFDISNGSSIYTNIPQAVKVNVSKNGFITEEPYNTTTSNGSSYTNGAFISTNVGTASLTARLIGDTTITNTIVFNTNTPTNYNYFLNGPTNLRVGGQYAYEITKYYNETEVAFNGDISLINAIAGLLRYSSITNGQFNILVNSRNITGTTILHIEDADGAINTTITVSE